MRNHLENAASGFVVNREAADRLDNAPSLPSLTASLWALFHDFHRRRVYTVDGPQRLTYEAIHARQSVTGFKIPHWDLGVLFAVEDVFFEVYAERPK